MSMPIGKLPSRLICCHCGGGCVGRQWWNRDTGYGVCRSCVARVATKPDLHDPGQTEYDTAELRSMWGVAGVHYNCPPDNIPEHLRETDAPSPSPLT